MGAAGLVKAGSRDVVCQGSAGVLREGLTATWLGHQGDSQTSVLPQLPPLSQPQGHPQDGSEGFPKPHSYLHLQISHHQEQETPG